MRLPVLGLLERVAEDPNQPLISTEERSVTADEFAHIAASIGARLATGGDDSPVVVLVDRSLTSMASIVGVEWSGRCVVPVGADEPRARLEGIIARVGACTIADATSGSGRTVAGHDVVQLANVTSEWIDPVPFASDRPALIVFTSGSTGQPKGVNWLGWQLDSGVYPLSQRPGRRTAVFGPLQWLAGVGGVHQAMFNGHLRLVDAVALGPAGIMHDLRLFGVERMSLTSSLLHSLASEVERTEPFNTLKEVTLAGEAVSWHAVEVARSLASNGIVVRSVYGASESMRTLTTIEIQPDEPLRKGLLPMGKLEWDHVELEPVKGVDDKVYEMIVKNWIVAGYLGDEELNNQRFGVDADGNRFWRSGDVVSVDEGDVLHYRGRSDDMVKISGKLVEPSEAARVLERCEGVRKVAVLPRVLHGRHTQLVAHVEAVDGTSPDAVREQLERVLPPHLIPAVIVRHDQLPMTNRGKLDRQRLIGAALVPWRSDKPTSPKSDLERLVLDEASSMLGVAELGVDDDLWRFGLDSLGAIELTEVLVRRVGVKVDVNDFVGASTPAQIAGLLAGSTTSSPIVDFGLGRDSRKVFAIAGAGSPAVTLRPLAVELGPIWRCIGVEQRLFDAEGEMTISAAAQRSVRAIREFEPSGPYRLVGYSWGGVVAHEMAVMLRDLGEEVSVVLLDSANPAVRGAREWRDRVSPVAQSVPKRLRRFVHRPAVFVRQYVGSSKEFWRGFKVAVAMMHHHRPQTFGGPMLVIETEESECGRMWAAEPRLQVVRVNGGHDELILQPLVAEVGSYIEAFLDSHRVDGN